MQELSLMLLEWSETSGVKINAHQQMHTFPLKIYGRKFASLKMLSFAMRFIILVIKMKTLTT